MLKDKAIIIRRFARTEEIPAADWSLQGAPYNPFHELSFLKVLEQSEVEGAVYDYLIFYQNESPIATAVLSCFSIDLSLFIGAEWWVKRIKKVWPNCFHVKVLFCGTPVSIGHTNFQCIEEETVILKRLSETMVLIAKERGVNILVFKEVTEQEKTAYDPVMTDAGWFAGHSLPDTKMDICWKKYSQYLGDLKSSYRRQVLDALALMNPGAKPSASESEALLQQLIEVQSAEEVSTADVFQKYMAVMDRAAVKLETLNAAFFAQLQAQYKGQLKYFVSRAGQEDQCYAVCLKNGEHFHFLWTAKRQEKDDNNSYVNQLQAMIMYAINNGITKMHIGQTAYYPKMRIGAVPEERYLFFKSLHPVYHPILKQLRNALFPPFPLPTIQPFKK